MGARISFYFDYKGWAQGDANNILTPGVYSVNRMRYNIDNVYMNYGLLIVFGKSDTFIGQKTMNITGESYERVYSASEKEWSDWVKV